MRRNLHRCMFPKGCPEHACVCIRVCVYECMCLCVWLLVCLCVCVFVYACEWMYADVCVYVSSRACLHVYMCVSDKGMGVNCSRIDYFCIEGDQC